MVRLAELQVVVVDCQATGASPRRGHLLELAWCRARASCAKATDLRTHLVALPAGASIPRRVTRLTGIREQDLVGAPSVAWVWQALLADIDGASSSVAHFARFERAFLDAAHREHGDGPFPLAWICTHEIARRVYPALPRRSLRALAGYLGHLAGQQRRAAEHVRATVAIWSGLVQQLEQQGVDTLEALHHWLAIVPPPAAQVREFPLARERRLALPDAPGVYRMLGRGRQLLYVGKASSLRRRVSSYYHRRPRQAERTLELLTQTWQVEVTVTASPLEAALLETDEIKRHRPPYNVALRERAQAWFASSELDSCSTRADTRHTLGPLPGRVELDAARQLCQLVAGRPAPARLALGLPDWIEPPPEILQEGVERFRTRHGPWPAVPLAGLLRLGARLWRAWRADDPVADEPEPEPARGTRAWTPERVTATLERSVLRFTHLLRRARWLCLLSESSLAWAVGDRHRMLVLQGGQVVTRGDLPPGASPPLPPGSGRGVEARRRCFDAATYDRLRVLTTELRRLASEGAWIELRVDARSTLRGPALGRRLYWV